MSGLFSNYEGRLSGAKAVLWLAFVLALAWSIRDLISNRELTETHAALLAVLLVVGLINRLSARRRFRLKLNRDGAELEAGDDPQD